MSAPCRIRVLPDLLVSKIAAGEVVERPASVVKELLENAIDAEAGRIAVTIEDGGRQLIRVSDDGCGMSPEELRLSVTAHATSKVRTEDDLFCISTMGFRGEALSSIASVSKLRIVSRIKEAVEGHEVRVAGERFEFAQAAGCPAGTTVEVRDLFFNVPARRKFLRTASTEMAHINEHITRIALAVPRVTMEVVNNRRATLNLPGCGARLERIGKFFGPELASALLHIEMSERGVGLEIYAAPPDQSRATAQWQYTFVNGRYVRDKYVQHAIKEAYRGLMDPNRHGVVFVFLTLDPHDVDVNVHPTKIEVRFADSNLIHSQVLSALRETFQRCDLAPALRTERLREPVTEADQDRVRREFAAILKAVAPLQSAGHRGEGAGGSMGPGDIGMARPGALGGVAGDPLSTWRSLYSPPAPPTKDGSTPQVPSPVGYAKGDSACGLAQDGQSAPSAAEAGAPLVVSGRRAIQMHNLYLVAETEDGIVIVDQHALHERVIYEQLARRIAEGPLQSQRLLLPETFTVTPQEAALLETHAGLLERLGIEVTPFGTDAVAVHSLPGLLKDTEVLSFVRDLLDELAQQAVQPGTEALIHKVLDMMACKAAVKAGDPLTQVEVEALFDQRNVVEKSSSCPHGRPTMLRLSKAELEKQFKRV